MKGVRAPPDARILRGQFRRNLPGWSIALLFKKGAKVPENIKVGQKYGNIIER